MHNEYIRQGETFEVTFEDQDPTAATVTLTISDASNLVVKSITVPYSTVNSVLSATISFADPLLLVGAYKYMYTITYSDGYILKLPDVDKCDNGDCELPDFIVCESNDIVS